VNIFIGHNASATLDSSRVLLSEMGYAKVFALPATGRYQSFQASLPIGFYLPQLKG
jgi:hypothetical protein